MAAARSLEARYRRLLSWFPAEHRRQHGEEMAGVLLATAEPGRDRPGRAESVNLMLSGLRVRLRPGGALADGDGWRDTLAIFSVVLPILVLAGASVAVLAEQARFSLQFFIVYNLILYGQLLTVPLVLLGLRRWAVVATCPPVALSAWWLGLDLYHSALNPSFFTSYFFVDGGVFGVYVLIGGVLEIVALLASPGPRCGRRLLRGKRWAYVAVAVLPAAAIAGGPDGLLQIEAGTNGSASVLGPFIAIVAAAVISLSVVWLTSALGKRLAVLFAVLVCAYLAAASLELSAQIPISFVPGALTLFSEVATAVVAVVVVRRVRHRSRL
jgi:hypothetical protein